MNYVGDLPCHILNSKGRFIINGNDRVGKIRTTFENLSFRGDRLCVFFLEQKDRV